MRPLSISVCMQVSRCALPYNPGKHPIHSFVHANQAVEDVSAAGKCCVLDIDVQGARLVRRSKLKAIFVFIAPPSTEELEKRLRGRGTESDEAITERMRNAKEEIARLGFVSAGRATLCLGKVDMLDEQTQHLCSL